MNINECYEFVQLVANKEQGGFISPVDFNSAMDAAQMEFFNDRYGQPATYQPGRPVPTVGYPQSQKVHDDIGVMLTHERVYRDGIDPYKELENGEYLHLVGAYYKRNTGYVNYPVHSKENYPLEIMESDPHLQSSMLSTMLEVNEQSPRLFYRDGGKMFFQGVNFDENVDPKNPSYDPDNVPPNNGDEVYVLYLRRPQRPVWNYMYDDNGRPVYSEKGGVIPLKQITQDIHKNGALQVVDSTTNLDETANTHFYNQSSLVIPDDSVQYNIYFLDKDGNKIMNNVDVEEEFQIIEFNIDSGDGTVIENIDGYFGVLNGAQIDLLDAQSPENFFVDAQPTGMDVQPVEYSSTSVNGDGMIVLDPSLAGFYRIVFQNKLKGSHAHRIKIQSINKSKIIRGLKIFSTGSIGLELPQQTHLEICFRALGYLGINLSETALAQYAEQKQTQTPGV